MKDIEIKNEGAKMMNERNEINAMSDSQLRAYHNILMMNRVCLSDDRETNERHLILCKETAKARGMKFRRDGLLK